MEIISTDKSLNQKNIKIIKIMTVVFSSFIYCAYEFQVFHNDSRKAHLKKKKGKIWYSDWL